MNEINKSKESNEWWDPWFLVCSTVCDFFKANVFNLILWKLKKCVPEILILFLMPWLSILVIFLNVISSESSTTFLQHHPVVDRWHISKSSRWWFRCSPDMFIGIFCALPEMDVWFSSDAPFLSLAVSTLSFSLLIWFVSWSAAYWAPSSSSLWIRGLGMPLCSWRRLLILNHQSYYNLRCWLIQSLHSIDDGGNIHCYCHRYLEATSPVSALVVLAWCGNTKHDDNGDNENMTMISNDEMVRLLSVYKVWKSNFRSSIKLQKLWIMLSLRDATSAALCRRHFPQL